MTRSSTVSLLSGSVRLTATVRSIKVVSPTARAHLLDRDHAGDFRRYGGDFLGGAFRRHIGEGVDGAATEPPAGDADQDRDRQRGRRIRPPQAKPHPA